MFYAKRPSSSNDGDKNFNFFCLGSFLILLIPSIFSKKLRQTAIEAFNCISKKIALKPCDVSLDDKVRAKLLSKTAISHPRLARFIAYYFEVISYIVFFIIFAAVFFLSKKVYLLLNF